MNDRLMIAAMALQGMVVNNYWEEVHFSAAATDAFRMADALLATAGEQESKPGHWHAVAMRQVDEIEALTARAEAAETKVALTESIIDDIKAQVAALKAECAEAWRVHSEVVAELKAKLAKYTEPLTDNQVASLADDWALPSHEFKLIDASIRRVRRGE